MQYFSQLWATEFSQTAHLAWKISAASSEASSHVSLVTYMPLLFRVRWEPWAPLASLGPAVIQYVPHPSSCVPSFMRLLSAFLAVMEWSSVFFSPHQGPQGDKGSRGETVRGAVLMNPCLSVLWAQNRILSKETAHHSASSCPSALFISYCVPLFVVTLAVTLSCCGNPVSVINVGLLHVSELFKRFVERSHTA